jgi:hypothetical protein
VLLVGGPVGSQRLVVSIHNLRRGEGREQGLHVQLFLADLRVEQLGLGLLGLFHRLFGHDEGVTADTAPHRLGQDVMVGLGLPVPQAIATCGAERLFGRGAGVAET